MQKIAFLIIENAKITASAQLWGLPGPNFLCQWPMCISAMEGRVSACRFRSGHNSKNIHFLHPRSLGYDIQEQQRGNFFSLSSIFSLRHRCWNVKKYFVHTDSEKRISFNILNITAKLRNRKFRSYKEVQLYLKNEVFSKAENAWG